MNLECWEPGSENYFANKETLMQIIFSNFAFCPHTVKLSVSYDCHCQYRFFPQIVKVHVEIVDNFRTSSLACAWKFLAENEVL